MLLNNKNGLNNSLGPDIYKDDLTALNYRAFARWIAGCEIDGEVVYPSADRVLNEFHLYDKDYTEYERYKERCREKAAGKGRRRKRCPIKLINTLTKEELIFENQYRASEFLGMHKSSVAYFLKNKTTTRNGWKAEYYEVEN